MCHVKIKPAEQRLLELHGHVSIPRCKRPQDIRGVKPVDPAKPFLFPVVPSPYLLLPREGEINRAARGGDLGVCPAPSGQGSKEHAGVVNSHIRTRVIGEVALVSDTY